MYILLIFELWGLESWLGWSLYSVLRPLNSAVGSAVGPDAAVRYRGHATVPYEVMIITSLKEKTIMHWSKEIKQSNAAMLQALLSLRYQPGHAKMSKWRGAFCWHGNRKLVGWHLDNCWFCLLLFCIRDFQNQVKVGFHQSRVFVGLSKRLFSKATPCNTQVTDSFDVSLRLWRTSEYCQRFENAQKPWL